jgi:hypothetical protein
VPGPLDGRTTVADMHPCVPQPAHAVGYHLHKVYAKLGLTARFQLHNLSLGGDPGP